MSKPDGEQFIAALYSCWQIICRDLDYVEKVVGEPVKTYAELVALPYKKQVLLVETVMGPAFI